jgi:putative SbcD/Mre11-related phosphoesterase
VKQLAEKINQLRKLTKTTRLIFIGDLKHKVPVMSFQEARDIPDFLERLDYKKIIIIKGNHDGDIEKIMPEHVKVKNFFSFGNYYFTHGHRNINTKKKIIVIGHNHPHIRFIDDVGARYNVPVWAKGPVGNKTIILMPAFNELLGGATINEKGSEFLGPIAKKLDKKTAHVFMLDGTDLGAIANLEVEEE